MSKIKSENLVWFLDELANSESYQFEYGDLEIVVGDEHGNEGVTTVAVQDLAASAIQEITSLVEQNKVLKLDLVELETFREKSFEAHPNIDMDIEALKQAK